MLVVQRKPRQYTSNLSLLDKENITRQYIDDYPLHIENNNLLEVSTMSSDRIFDGSLCNPPVCKRTGKGTLIEIPLDSPI